MLLRGEHVLAVHEYLKQHGRALVSRALRDYRTLSECVAVLPMPDPPRLLARATDISTVRRDYPAPDFHDHYARQVTDEDELLVVGAVDGVPFVDLMSLGRVDGRDRARPLSNIQPFSNHDMSVFRFNLIRDAVGEIETQLTEQCPDPRLFVMYWAVFDAPPVTMMRTSAKPRLGRHPHWRSMLPDLYTPSDHFLSLVDFGVGPVRRFEKGEFVDPTGG